MLKAASRDHICTTRGVLLSSIGASSTRGAREALAGSERRSAGVPAHQIAERRQTHEHHACGDRSASELHEAAEYRREAAGRRWAS